MKFHRCAHSILDDLVILDALIQLMSTLRLLASKYERLELLTDRLEQNDAQPGLCLHCHCFNILSSIYCNFAHIQMLALISALRPAIKF